jgi:hypothetical protein
MAWGLEANESECDEFDTINSGLIALRRAIEREGGHRRVTGSQRRHLPTPTPLGHAGASGP